MSRLIDISGQKFNRLLVVSFSNGYWSCLCDCGNLTKAKSNDLRTGHKTSCGCRSKETLQLRTKHNLCNTKIYFTYKRMLDRCFNKNCPRYEYYQGRGITVCSRWLGPQGLHNFVSDLGNPPTSKHSLDRINNNGNYEPSNCKWSTQSEQLSNRRPYKWKLK